MVLTNLSAYWLLPSSIDPKWQGAGRQVSILSTVAFPKLAQWSGHIWGALHDYVLRESIGEWMNFKWITHSNLTWSAVPTHSESQPSPYTWLSRKQVPSTVLGSPLYPLPPKKRAGSSLPGVLQPPCGPSSSSVGAAWESRSGWELLTKLVEDPEAVAVVAPRVWKNNSDVFFFFCLIFLQTFAASISLLKWEEGRWCFTDKLLWAALSEVCN